MPLEESACRAIIHLTEVLEEMELDGLLERGSTVILSPDGCFATQDGKWEGSNWIRTQPLGKGKLLGQT